MELHLKKNQAAEIMFPMVTTASPETFDTGETVTDTAYYKDGAGAWTSLAITDTVTEIGTTGMYTIELTAAELNHDLVTIKFTSTNAADTAVIIRTFDVDIEDLVRSTTPANSLDVSATGEAGIDWANVGGQSTSVNLSNTTTNLVNTVTTYTGNTPQTGDAYAIVNNGTYGNAQLVRSTTPANTLDVNATGGAGLDWANVDGQTSAVTLSNTTVGTVTANTDMRGTDNALLAASAPTNFGDLAITVTAGEVTVGTNNDKTGYTASTVTDKTGYSISGTKTTLDALNDIAATDVVSSGAITTLAGAVVNVDTVDTLTTYTGNTPQTGDNYARLGAPAGVSVSADVAAVQADTDNIQTRLPAALIGGRMDSDIEAINNSTTAAVQLALSANEIESGACEGTPTTTVIQTDLAETQDDIYIGRVVIFTSGNARGEATDITDYAGATGTLTVTALANAPAATDTFILL
ncbi:MAG: hypothetical protein OES84_00130 [Kiritimatiellaceae bacterium]|nr:hypothetical protein [Kiritimatiellaceae bacterium]